MNNIAGVDATSFNEPIANRAIEASLPQPTRVLHVLATASQGGVETWLCNALSKFDATRFESDVLFYRSGRNDLKERLAFSARDVFEVHLRDSVAGLVNFQNALRKLIRRKKYDVVHCHGLSFMGIALYCAWRERVPVRVAHSHGTSEPNRRFAERLFLAFAKKLTKIFATHRVGCSTEAAEAVFGDDCVSKGTTVIYCGLDLSQLGSARSSASKEAFDIPKHATALGCVANFTAAKNHKFLLKIFAQILQRHDEMYLILVGDGPCRLAIEKQAEALGISKRIRYLGNRQDALDLFAIFDVFVLPSLTEGLPVALLEAQASGVPCVTSTAVTKEAEVIPGLVAFLPLNAGLDFWAETVVAKSLSRLERNAEQSRKAFKGSPYDINSCVSHLQEIYLSP
jgi:glycosyltransferase involved in cell wall biosynthesis